MNYDEAKALVYTKTGYPLMVYISDDDIKQGISYIKELTSCDDQTAKLIWCDLKMDYGTKESNPILQAREGCANESPLNIPKCPICNSTSLSKISGVKKAAKIGAFGIFGAGDIGKTWKCNNCGSKF